MNNKVVCALDEEIIGTESMRPRHIVAHRKVIQDRAVAHTLDSVTASVESHELEMHQLEIGFAFNGVGDRIEAFFGVIFVQPYCSISSKEAPN